MTYTENLPCLYPATSERVYMAHEKLLMRNLRAYAEYEVEVNNWYLRGDGRPVSKGGRGYAFPRCIHGTDLWTSYDNICGGCEGGYGSWDSAREFNDTYFEAVNMIGEYERRIDVVLAFIESAREGLGSRLPESVRQGLFDWALEPVA